jgi:hypothetical protein
LWGAVLPVLAIALLWPTREWSLLLFLLYPLLVLKTRWYARRNRMPAPDATLYALGCTLAKFPQLLGQLKFLGSRISGRRSEIIEYKPIR